MNSHSPFSSAHTDVLDAPIPADAAAKARLVEELKNRARGAVQMNQWPAARQLYTKALDVVGATSEASAAADEQAILQANLALVYGKMGQWSASQVAAGRAIELNGNYVKGWWRLGQAHAALHAHAEAVRALETAVQLEPSNKALQKELEKQRSALDNAKLAPPAPASSIPVPNTPGTNTTPASKKAAAAAATTTTTTTANIKPQMNAATTDKDDDDVQFTKSEAVRGYKVINGKKTSYFHNELSDDAKALIGDIAPKKLENMTIEHNVDNNKATSAWNTAGTWEERDASVWAQTTLHDMLQKAATFVLPPSAPPADGATTVVTATGVNVSGHASVATVRGKQRYIYELVAEISWTVDQGDDDDSRNNIATGTLTLPDIDGTCMLGDPYDATFEIKSCDDDAWRPVLERHVHQHGFRDVVHGIVDDWVRRFQAEY